MTTLCHIFERLMEARVKIDRLLSIVMILLEKKKVSASELAQTFEVSVRTIYRDVDTINQAGLPVVTYPGAKGGIGILESYKAEKRFFTSQDVTMILMGLGSIRTSYSSAEVAGAIAKIKGLVPEAERKAIELQAGQVSIDLTPWSNNHAGMAALVKIQQALKDTKLLEFDYNDRKGQRSARRVEPYKLILKRRSWYLGGYCLLREGMRLFKVSRMVETKLCKESFSPRTVATEDFIVRNFDDAECMDGIIRISARARETIVELFGDAALEQENENTWLARIPLTDNDQGHSFVASLGCDAEVLAPECIRESMKEYFRKAMSVYC